MPIIYAMVRWRLEGEKKKRFYDAVDCNNFEEDYAIGEERCEDERYALEVNRDDFT